MAPRPSQLILAAVAAFAALALAGCFTSNAPPPATNAPSNTAPPPPSPPPPAPPTTSPAPGGDNQH